MWKEFFSFYLVESLKFGNCTRESFARSIRHADCQRRGPSQQSFAAYISRCDVSGFLRIFFLFFCVLLCVCGEKKNFFLTVQQVEVWGGGRELGSAWPRLEGELIVVLVVRLIRMENERCAMFEQLK